MELPDYHGGSIVNLMRSVEGALGARACAAAAAYPELDALPAQALAGARNVVLLVIDGLGYDYLSGAGAGGALHRHLRARLTSVFPSTTATAVSTFLTGVGPQQHALTGWHIWLRELGCLAATLRFRPRHGGEPLSRAGIAPRSVYTAEPMFDRLAAIAMSCRRRALSIPTTTSRIAGAPGGGHTRNCPNCFRRRPKSCAATTSANSSMPIPTIWMRRAHTSAARARGAGNVPPDRCRLRASSWSRSQEPVPW